MIAGCIQQGPSPSDCNPQYFISEQERFQPILDKESAYQILVALEPGWDPDSDLYKEYKGSKILDLEYKEIQVAGRGIENKYAYVLKDQLAIDSNGQVYRKGGCI